MDVNLEFSKDKPKRVEILNYKSEAEQKAFKASTTETKEFTDCFTTNNSLTHQIENCRKVLGKHCRKSFNKICIRKNTKINQLLSLLIKEIQC